MKVAKQTTLRDHTALCGVGIHSGLPVTLTLHPADADTGLRFIRTRVDGWQDREIAADMSAVTATEFATVLGDASGPLVSTAEHVLAALSGLGVDNAVIEIDGPEAPIMDGSAAPFVAAIDAVGLETLDQPRRHIAHEAEGAGACDVAAERFRLHVDRQRLTPDQRVLEFDRRLDAEAARVGAYLSERVSPYHPHGLEDPDVAPGLIKRLKPDRVDRRDKRGRAAVHDRRLGTIDFDDGVVDAESRERGQYVLGGGY